MAAQAGALAFEHNTPARRISRFHGAAVERVHVAEIRNQARHFGRVQAQGGHPGGRKAVGDDDSQLWIGDGIPELAVAQRHSGDAVAIGAMAPKQCWA